jgi:succinyl-diaminopimelate desuccinylase
MTTQEIIKLTKQLVAIPSTADNPATLHEAVNFLTLIVASHPNITIEGFERNGKPSFLAYSGHVRPSKFDILLNAHVDVVPGKPDQFTAVEKDGRLYGRGVLDMKGTALILTDVFCEMVNKVPYKLGLEIVSDEEIGGYDGARFHIDEGVRSSFVVNGEYANHRNTIYNAARGMCWVELAFRGKEAHGGHPWKGDNAIIKAGSFVAAVLEKYPTPDKETWTTTANISSLSSPNQTLNKVPDHAVLKIDFRFTQEDPVFENEENLRAFIANIDPDAELTKLVAFEPAVNVEELNPYVQGLSRALKRVTKTEPTFLGRPASSDGRHFAMVNNDVVEFGLYGQNSHSDGEYVALDSFTEYQAVMRAFLKAPTRLNPKDTIQKAPKSESAHLQVFRLLVNLPTVTGDFMANNTALSYIANYLRGRGMFIEEFERGQCRSIVATTRPGAKEPAVMLSAHIDVVPAAPDQFKLRIRGDKLLGRGVMDMKFSIAAYLALVDSMQGELGDYDFGIMITSDEEVGSNNGTAYLVQEQGYKPRVAVVPDGGENWQLESFSKGLQWIKLTAKGQSGHASRPWEGSSAITRLLDAIKEIQALVPGNPLPEETFLSVGTIEGGTTANQIPTHATAMLDIRYGSVQDYLRLPASIKSITSKHGVYMTISSDAGPTTTDPNNYYVKPFVDIVSRITGKAHDTSISYGTSDARHFGAAGVPSVVIQPPGGNTHKDGEWLSNIGFEQFCVILEEYVRRMADLRPDRKAAKDQDVARLAKRLNSGDKPAYVWYVTYGSGLSKENFVCTIAGGKPIGGRKEYIGCRDKTMPIKDTFISLPYEIYFAGDARYWGGAHAYLSTTSQKNAHTLARAYLITVEQLEDIAAQENLQRTSLRLPLAVAIRDGHTPINNVTGERAYDELLYCGLEANIPMFTLTAMQEDAPRQLPTDAYALVLCSGLSQNPDFNIESAIDFATNDSSLAGHFKKQTITKLLEDLSQ